jgi:hypothetical protein
MFAVSTFSGTSVVDPDTDPAFYLNADLDPDQESQTNENPCGPESWAVFAVTKS